MKKKTNKKKHSFSQLHILYNFNARKPLEPFKNMFETGVDRANTSFNHRVEYVRNHSKTDSMKSQISSKTSSGKKDDTNRRHQRHHQRQPSEQLFPIQVASG